MKVSIILSQFKITLDIKHNLNKMLKVIEQAKEDEIVVFPEGSLSGYSTDISFLQKVDLTLLNAALKILREEAKKRAVHLIFGSCIYESGSWFNAGVCYSYLNEDLIYRKINLAHHERDQLAAGDALLIYPFQVKNGMIKIALQLCREIRFPEQWKLLARGGADIFFYLTNAVNGHSVDVWRSHLISRAAENQRFVVSVNNAHDRQLCPTMLIKPNGEVISEIVSDGDKYERHIIDLEEVSNWYIEQSRVDVVDIVRKLY